MAGQFCMVDGQNFVRTLQQDTDEIVKSCTVFDHVSN